MNRHHSCLNSSASLLPNVLQLISMNQKFEIILRDEIVQKSFIFTALYTTPKNIFENTGAMMVYTESCFVPPPLRDKLTVHCMFRFL